METKTKEMRQNVERERERGPGCKGICLVKSNKRATANPV